MLRTLLIIGFAILAACGRPDDAGKASEESVAKIPLEEVEKILTGETKVGDPAVAGAVPADPVKPAVPVAKPVPDKLGFVISPYNGKWIDVRGVAPGELMLDPHFPVEEKKYFRVPEPTKPPAVIEEKRADGEITGLE